MSGTSGGGARTTSGMAGCSAGGIAPQVLTDTSHNNGIQMCERSPIPRILTSRVKDALSPTCHSEGGSGTFKVRNVAPCIGPRGHDP